MSARIMKIASVIVTYNRKDELIKNIRALNVQSRKVDKIYIIDNCSTDGTEELLRLEGFLNNGSLKYIKLDENIGGAGGFYVGLNSAYNDGFDFIILMDDDGRPANDYTFEKLIEKAFLFHADNKKMMINSVVICDDERKLLSFGLKSIYTLEEVMAESKDNVYKGCINPFNGTLVSRELVNEIGFPNKDFFIGGDEMDYQVRAERAGAYIATIVDSLYYHPTPEKYSVTWKGKIIQCQCRPSWRKYYDMRNNIYRMKRDEGLVSTVKPLMAGLYCAILGGQMNEILFLLKGYWDGIRGKLGKRLLPE